MKALKFHPPRDGLSIDAPTWRRKGQGGEGGHRVPNFQNPLGSLMPEEQSALGSCARRATSR
jgi:hypothetical protein